MNCFAMGDILRGSAVLCSLRVRVAGAQTAVDRDTGAPPGRLTLFARAAIAVTLFALSACSHLANETYLRQGCRDYAAALSQLAQLRSVGRLTADQIVMVDGQNALVIGTPEAGRYGVCTTLYEPSNPSGADATVKYGRNVLRGVIDEANAAFDASSTQRQRAHQDAPPPALEQAATYVHLHVLESVAFDAWDDIRADVITADKAWGG